MFPLDVRTAVLLALLALVLSALALQRYHRQRRGAQASAGAALGSKPN
ncbi:hypothetical protein FHS76_002495 [Ochrobactrum daejeonense]|uniref:Uncharacterized protein n=1 Tax=Brucella daejeonensis TaxID=659015 RepID=A0A7W9AY23_9HYPH|nr:hypothetical protein [Brucella daejeonensis]